MPKKIALDYDDSELRIVVAQCNGDRVQVTDARVIQIDESSSPSEKLRNIINEESLQKTETLVAIGRGKAELRELQLPAVPEDELPDMVRFQAIRSFTASSERAIVDFLITERASEGTGLIAAAVEPSVIDRIKEICNTSQLIPKRISLRPLSAASLYLRKQPSGGVSILIDLLGNDAEIVVARNGKVIFVRAVRLPASAVNRSAAIAGELKRTMVACGETEAPSRIVIWGTQAVHEGDIKEIKSTNDCEDIQAINPFDLVDLQLDSGELPEHVGRLAPLVGLLACDESAPETLIDFLNPRENVEEEPDRVRRVLMIALPIAAVFVLAFLAYSNLASLDRQIEIAKQEVEQSEELAEKAEESVARTEVVNQFLDADVNWLDELRRLAEKAPPSDQLIVNSIVGNANPRDGGGKLVVVGAVTDAKVIDQLEEALRDPKHSVVGKGSQEQKSKDAYRWSFTEGIALDPENLRSTRMERMETILASTEANAEPAGEGEAEAATSNGDSDLSSSEPTESKPSIGDATTEAEPVDEAPTSDDSSSDDSSSDDSSSDDSSSDDSSSQAVTQEITA